jgi:ubiquitin-protein ligase E3 D
VQGDHYEIKLSTLSASETSPRSSPIESVPLLDATQLSRASPTSFICASCSLPLVQSSTITQYRDLPSEHWQELVDAWMCHSDQKLHEHVSRCSQGFWPEAGQALVGGSYILFEQSAVARNNLCLSDQSKVSVSEPFSSHYPTAGRSRRPKVHAPVQVNCCCSASDLAA